MAKSRVYEWCSKFKAGHTDVSDKVHPGPCFFAKIGDNKSRVKELIQTDWRLKIRDISESLNISKSTVHGIVFEELHYRKVSARWVPKELTADNKMQRAEVSQT
ncbi:protein GVQW3-like [Aplysia californica]|uniref:Protein GVQW3-like n=1 Tax=Aplysia californica TaxID=6500 RepID=A0ABM0JMJ2_APLCA|nr:protein GVQW3-like [Aplysia californica]